MIAPIAAGATRLPMIFSGLGRLMSQGGRMGVLSGRGRGAFAL